MYHENIKEITKENKNFRNVLYTGTYSQLVVMSLKLGEEIGERIDITFDSLDQRPRRIRLVKCHVQPQTVLRQVDTEKVCCRPRHTLT